MDQGLSRTPARLDDGRAQRLINLLHQGADRIRQLEAEMQSLRLWAAETLVAAGAKQAAAEHQIRQLRSCLEKAEAHAKATEKKLHEVEGLQEWLGLADAQPSFPRKPLRAA